MNRRNFLKLATVTIATTVPVACSTQKPAPTPQLPSPLPHEPKTMMAGGVIYGLRVEKTGQVVLSVRSDAGILKLG